LGRERVRLEKVVEVLDQLESSLRDSEELLEMAVEENDEGTL
jgi:peptide chain release factor 2